MLDSLVTAVRNRRGQLRRIGLALAIAIFVAGFILATLNAPYEELSLSMPILLAYAIFLPPIAYFLQSAELWLSAKAVGVTLSRRAAIEIIIYANAAALLPIPGGLLTRTAALRANGVSVARSASVVVLFTGIAGSVSFAYSGLWVAAQNPILGIAGLIVAAVGTAVCVQLARKLDVHGGVLRKDVALRLLSVIFETGSFIVIFAAIGASITVQQAAFLVISGFLAMALTIFPSGLGIKEAIVALISPLVGIDSATAFLAAAAGRIVGLVWMAGIGLVILASGQSAGKVER